MNRDSKWASQPAGVIMRLLLILPIPIVTVLSLPAIAQPLSVARDRIEQASNTSKQDSTLSTASVDSPVQVHPGTIVLNSDVLARLRVFVPAAQVVRAIGPRLIVVTDVRPFRDPIVRPELEELLLVLPMPTDVAVAEVIKVVGRVRTISGMRREADGRGVLDEIAQAVNSKRYRGATLLVVESAQTLDGVDLR
jgi:hypothetical protein